MSENEEQTPTTFQLTITASGVVGESTPEGNQE